MGDKDSAQTGDSPMKVDTLLLSAVNVLGDDLAFAQILGTLFTPLVTMKLLDSQAAIAVELGIVREHLVNEMPHPLSK